MRAALGGLLGNSTTDATKCGNPDTNRIAVPIPIVLGKFFQKVQIFPVVKVEGGDAKDQAAAELALSNELQKVAFRCNFEKKGGIAAPAGCATFTLTLIKDQGQSTFTTNRTDGENWGGSSNRHGSSNRSETGSSFTSGESIFVSSSVGGGLDLHENDGSTTGLASVGDVFSADAQRTASAHQDSTTREYSSSSKKWGNDYSGHFSTDGSTFQTDSAYAKRQSSRVTINEAVEKAVYCVLAQGIDYYNVTKGPKQASSVPAPATEKQVSGSGYTGDPRYIAEDE